NTNATANSRPLRMGGIIRSSFRQGQPEEGAVALSEKLSKWKFVRSVSSLADDSLSWTVSPACGAANVFENVVQALGVESSLIDSAFSITTPVLVTRSTFAV